MLEERVRGGRVRVGERVWIRKIRERRGRVGRFTRRELLWLRGEEGFDVVGKGGMRAVAIARIFLAGDDGTARRCVEW